MHIARQQVGTAHEFADALEFRHQPHAQEQGDEAQRPAGPRAAPPRGHGGDDDEEGGHGVGRGQEERHL